MSFSVVRLAVIGQGSAPGVKVRVEAMRGRPQAGGAADPVAGPEIDALEQRWALAADAYTATAQPDGLTLKISRRVDRGGSDWLWVGLYRPALFSRDRRGGLYFGAGILFGGAPEPLRAVEAVSTLFQQSEAALFDGDVMVGSVESFDVARLGIPDVGSLGQFPGDAGLNPRASEGLLIPDFDVRKGSAEAFQECLLGRRYAAYATVYFCRAWLDGRERRFPDLEARNIPQVTRHEPAAERYEPASVGAFERPQSPPAENFQEQVLHKLRLIEQRTIGIERQLFASNEKSAPLEPRASPSAQSGIVRMVLLTIVVLLSLATIYFAADTALSWWRGRSGLERSAAQASPEHADEEAEAGPRVMVKPFDVTVAAGQRLRVLGIGSAHGGAAATISIVLREHGDAIASDYRTGERAQAEAVLEKAGTHHLIGACEARRAVVDSCSIEAAGAEGGAQDNTPPNG